MNHQFTDSKGRAWNIVTDLNAARRLRRAGHDLMSYENAGTEIPQLYTDELMMVEALYAIVLPQAERMQVSEDEFFESMTAETFDRAREALMGALPDFFSGRKKEIIGSMIASFGPSIEARAAEVIRNLESPGSGSTSTSASSDSTAAA